MKKSSTILKIIEEDGLSELLHPKKKIQHSSTSLLLMKKRKYYFYAYPGKEIAGENTPGEHLPYHFHVKIKESKKELGTYKITIKDFEEYDAKILPKDLKKILKNPLLQQELFHKTISVYNKGTLMEYSTYL